MAKFKVGDIVQITSTTPHINYISKVISLQEGLYKVLWLNLENLEWYVSARFDQFYFEKSWNLSTEFSLEKFELLWHVATSTCAHFDPGNYN